MYVFIYRYHQVEPDKDDETLANFFEYTLATQIYHSLMESSRMNAMENASKVG